MTFESQKRKAEQEGQDKQLNQEHTTREQRASQQENQGASQKGQRESFDAQKQASQQQGTWNKPKAEEPKEIDFNKHPVKGLDDQQKKQADANQKKSQEDQSQKKKPPEMTV